MKVRPHFAKDLLKWYSKNGRDFQWRRKNYPFYKLIVCEILLWKTRAESVESFCSTFFNSCPSASTLKAIPTRKLINMIKPLGLYNRRAKMLKKFVKNYPPGRFKGEMEIRKKLGVGQYIARTLMVLHYCLPVIPVDENIRRLLERVHGFKIRNIRKISLKENEYLKGLVRNKHKELTWAMIDYSYRVCIPIAPRCSECCLSSYCDYRAGKGNADRDRRVSRVLG